jgi:predicted nucleic acid-binding protein
MVVLDTSIIIDHLRLKNVHNQSMLEKIAHTLPKEALCISVITVQELYEGLSTRDIEKEKYLLSTISPLRIIPYTYEIAQKAGEIARDLSRPIETADAAIAATAIINGADFATINTKDFRGISELALLN